MGLTTVQVQLSMGVTGYYEAYTNINLNPLTDIASVTLDDEKPESYIRFVHGICCGHPPIRLIDGNLPDALIDAYKESYMIQMSAVHGLENRIEMLAKPFAEVQSAISVEEVIDLSPPFVEDDLFSSSETEEIIEQVDDTEVTEQETNKKGRKKQS